MVNSTYKVKTNRKGLYLYSWNKWVKILIINFKKNGYIVTSSWIHSIDFLPIVLFYFRGGNLRDWGGEVEYSNIPSKALCTNMPWIDTKHINSKYLHNKQYASSYLEKIEIFN